MINRNDFQKLTVGKSIKPFAIYAASVFAAAVMTITGCISAVTPTTKNSETVPPIT
jgi:hypothetical protein